jgi:hypothetical protein
MFPAQMLIDPTPDLPDDTEIKGVRLPTRIRNALTEAGVKTIGELRHPTLDSSAFKVSEAVRLLSFARGSGSHLDLAKPV